MTHTQHRMSVGTFQANVAVGNWVGQPFMPSSQALADALKPSTKRKLSTDSLEIIEHAEKKQKKA
jgi:hypothetical protein